MGEASPATGLRKCSSRDMLNSYLYELDHVSESVSRGAARVLRSGNDPPFVSRVLQEQKTKEKKEAAAVRKLETEMDRLTNEALLRDATEYQQGQNKASLPMSRFVTDVTQASKEARIHSSTVFVVDRG